MNEKGSRYALSALKNKRATIAAEIVHLKRQLRHRKEHLVHVDATIRLLDPSIETDAIPNKRLVKRVKLFRQGELGRLILDTLRRAEGAPMSAREIVTAILAAGGHGEVARPTVAPRVRGNLAYLHHSGKVAKHDGGDMVRWGLA